MGYLLRVGATMETETGLAILVLLLLLLLLLLLFLDLAVVSLKPLSAQRVGRRKLTCSFNFI